MVFLNELPYIKVFKRKSYLPIDIKTVTKNSLAFLCNITIENSLVIIDDKHPMISGNNKFKSYYMDPIYKTTLFNKTKNLNAREERKSIYEKISDTTTTSPYLTIEAVNERNLYVDLFKYNDIFFNSLKSSITPIKRIEYYMNYLSKIIKDSKYDSYKSKVLLIDINDWIKDDNKRITTTVSLSKMSNNPIMYSLYSIMKKPEWFMLLGNIDIYLYTSDMILKINPSKIDDKTFSHLKIELGKMLKSVNIDNTDIALDDIPEDDEDESQTSNNQRAETNKDKYSNNEKESTDTKDSNDEEFSHEFDDEEDKPEDTEINSADIDDDVDDEEEDKPKTKEDSEAILSIEDNELITSMNIEMGIRKTYKSPESEARNKALKENQSKIVFNGKTVDDYIKREPIDEIIESEDISSHITSSNKNIVNVKFANYEKSYNEKLMKKDTMRVLTHLNNTSIPVYIRDIKVEDSSDELNYKETYTVHLEDENRVRHTLTFDMPKFIEDKFIYIGGNKKIIVKQIFMKPIIKTAPDTVQICSNYKKIFIRRYGSKLNPELEKFKKTIGNTFKGIKTELGDNTKGNNDYITIIDYDELASMFYTIKTKDMTIMFSQKDVAEKHQSKPGEMCIGFYSNGKPIILDIETERVEGKSLVDFLVYKLSDINSDFEKTYNETSAGAKRYMYSRATIMTKQVPVILLVGYCEGLSTVMRKGNIKHYFTDKRPTITDKQESIQFADGYLVYDRYPFENSLLMNGLLALPTKIYNYSDMDGIEPYVDMFDSILNARNLANAFDSFYEFMIDPITKEVLEDLNYPTDFVSVVLFANSLLADNSYANETDMHSYRIRSNEIVNVILHNEISNAYFKYRMTANNRNPVKLSIKKDAIIKELLSQQTVEDYSTLNPIFEVKKLRNASLKGLSGMNVSEAYTLDKRGYDKSMVGIFGISSSTDANVGITRQMALEPNVISPRGYIKVEDDLDNVKDVNMFTPAELLTPMGVTRDDGPRVSMASVQSSHIIPIDKSSPVLISNGTEQSLPYYLSSDFVIVADDDGEIVEVNEKTGIIIAKYKNGTFRAIDTKSRMAKNSSSGFYIDNKLRCDLKVGDKFKKKDILAYENRFFTNDSFNGNRFNIGSLQKVAIASSYSTFEDSCFITSKIADDLSTTVIMMKDVVIGNNANVDKIVKIGDKISVGDTLISFETSYDDSGMNKFLASIGDELGEDIHSLSKIPINSKYAGEISDIKIYSSVELDELSPSLRKIVSDYYSTINARSKQLNKYDKSNSIVKAGVFMNESTGKIQPSADGKLKGHEIFDGVLIEFYIKYNDRLGVGDKITFFSALKSVTCEQIEPGYEPYSEFRPDEEVSSFVGPSAILARMVPSTIATILGNKVIVELKRKLQEIYESK